MSFLQIHTLFQKPRHIFFFFVGVSYIKEAAGMQASSAKWGVLLIYLLPVFLAFLRVEEIEMGRVALSLLPILILAPSTFLPLLLPNEETEHVARHSVYATAFTVSCATSVRWDTIYNDFETEEWPLHIVLYLAVGSVTLWWFVMSHTVENRTGLFFTHQGDVAVLPLTLVAIGTFVESVPDDSFQFSRCIIFYVPIAVAWATLHYVAFNEFATSRTTTHTRQGFDHLSHCSLAISSAHLALIELRATPVSFLFFPIVASFLSQVAHRPTNPPPTREGSVFGRCALQVSLSALFGTCLLSLRFDTWTAPLMNCLFGLVYCLNVPLLCGWKWVLPTTLYTTLLLSSFLESDRRDSTPVRVVDVIFVFCQYLVTFYIVDVVASPEERQLSPPGPVPSDRSDTPQSRGGGFLPLIFAISDRLPVPSCHVHGEELVRRFLRRQDPSCPVDFAGVWWMRGTTHPCQLLTVHSSEWRTDSEGRLSSTFSLVGGSRSPTLSGVLNILGQSVCWTRVVSHPRDRWIRTPVWAFPYLRWFQSTYWLYRIEKDEMLRLIYNDSGRVTWQYRMLRVVRGDGTLTHHYQEYLSEYNGQKCLCVF